MTMLSEMKKRTVGGGADKQSKEQGKVAEEVAQII
jgi:hypothetical protein